MLKSLSRFASLALVAASAFAVRTLDAVRFAAAWLRDWAYSGLENLHQAPAGEVSEKRSEIRRTAARQYAALRLERKRPRVTSQWRMCPSV